MDDYLALDLAGQEGQALLGRLRGEVPRPYLLAFSRWMCVRAAVFSWVGVTMYLTLDAIHAALATMAGCRPGTRVVLTYDQPQAVLTGSTAQIAAAFEPRAAEMGEPFISRFLPGEMARLLHGHGFGQITDFGPDEARTAYFPGQADVDIAGAQRLIAATLAPGQAEIGWGRTGRAAYDRTHAEL